MFNRSNLKEHSKRTERHQATTSILVILKITLPNYYSTDLTKILWAHPSVITQKGNHLDANPVQGIISFMSEASSIYKSYVPYQPTKFAVRNFISMILSN